jgi:prolyl-tRNA synthetase
VANRVRSFVCLLQIGVCVMVHGDNKGLVLPPRVAPVQVIIVWILSNSDAAEVTAAVTETATQIEKSLKAAGVRVKVDDRDNYLPGWKYAHWEQKVWHWFSL